jgi:antitoxin HicB
VSELQYSMLIKWSNDDQAFLVTLPEWEGRVFGPVTHGSSYEEAVERGKDALATLIASATQHSEVLPVPRVYDKAPSELAAYTEATTGSTWMRDHNRTSPAGSILAAL